MKKIKFKYLIFIIVILVITVLYFIPDQKKFFFKLYGKDDKYSRTLKEFQSRRVKFINVNGVKWKYYSGGRGDKTILFLHGMGGTYDLWWNQIVAFENKYKVITYTLPEEINSLEKTTGGILAIVNKENIDRIYAVGTSMGGYITQYLLKTHPELIEKAVLGNTFPPNKYFAEQNSFLSKIVPYVPEILVTFIGEKSLESKIFPAANNDELLSAFLLSLPFSKKQLIGRYNIVVDYFNLDSTNEKMKRIPKLIIESDNDPLIPLFLRKHLKGFYNEAKIFTFHGKGHFPYINAAEKYNDILKEYFEH